MKFSHLLVLAIIFLSSASLCFWLVRHWLNRRLRNRLQAIRNLALDDALHPQIGRLETWAREVLSKLVQYSMDKEKWEVSPIRIRFLNAGYRGDLIILSYFGGKTFFALIFPCIFLLWFFLSDSNSPGAAIALMALSVATFGYYLPNLLLSMKIHERQREIFESFPDALDLIRVCVNAGLGLDAAIARVGLELSLKSEALADEFRLLNLELRAGATRHQALKNLAVRTGVDDIKGLVAMLIQSERFGTNVSDSLRVHADSLRVKRQLRAQEQAAKIPVKLTFPMALCILPALFVVILGPAALTVLRMLGGFGGQ